MELVTSKQYTHWRRGAILAIIAATGRTVRLTEIVKWWFVRLGDYDFTSQQAARIVRKQLYG